MIDLSPILDVFGVALLVSTIRLVSPILLAGLGGMFTERAGIFNIAQPNEEVATEKAVAELGWNADFRNPA